MERGHPARIRRVTSALSALGSFALSEHPAQQIGEAVASQGSPLEGGVVGLVGVRGWWCGAACQVGGIKRLADDLVGLPSPGFEVAGLEFGAGGVVEGVA